MSYQRMPGINRFAIAAREKALILKHFSFLTCRITNSILYCYGQCQPAEECPVYSYRIKYDPLYRPVVTVINPQIEYHDDIHVYHDDNSLCLFHKSDLMWDATCHLFNTIIPWTQEWFVFYELWKLKGEWLHPFVPHKKIDVSK